MAVVYLLDLQGGLTGGTVGYSRWVPSAMGSSEGTRAKVAEIRRQLCESDGEWVGSIDSHPGFPLVQVKYCRVGEDGAVVEMTVGGEWGTMLLLARGDELAAVGAFGELLNERGVPGASGAADVLAGRKDRPLFVRGNWIRGSASEAAVELAQLWVAMAFFEERGVLGG